jgi:glycosyltransferase involved in cell wall biosynthesis
VGTSRSSLRSASADPAHSPLRVAIDATPLVNGDTGVARYAAQHLAELAKRADVEAVPFAIGRGTDAGPGVRRFRTPLRVMHRSWQLARWPTAETLVGPADVVHSIDMVPPPTSRPLVMSVHDTLPLEIPHLYSQRAIRHAKAGLAQATRAQVVLALCDASADRIAEVAGVDRQRIVVASPGRRPELGAHEPLLQPPYLLAVGSVTPRKGFQVLIEALAVLGADWPPLIVAGSDGWRADEVRRRASDLGVDARVRFLGHVSDADLERLFRHASALVHPSVAEGFGIPCLEALGYSTPVVAADIPPVRELGADCIELVEPGDVDALAAGITRVLTDTEHAKAMVARGRERAAAYTWARMSQVIVEAYQRAVG